VFYICIFAASFAERHGMASRSVILRREFEWVMRYYIVCYSSTAVIYSLIIVSYCQLLLIIHPPIHQSLSFILPSLPFIPQPLSPNSFTLNLNLTYYPIPTPIPISKTFKNHTPSPQLALSSAPLLHHREKPFQHVFMLLLL
jgi:hypothetical protein